MHAWCSSLLGKDILPIDWRPYPVRFALDADVCLCGVGGLPSAGGLPRPATEAALPHEPRPVASGNVTLRVRMAGGFLLGWRCEAESAASEEALHSGSKVFAGTPLSSILSFLSSLCSPSLSFSLSLSLRAQARGVAPLHSRSLPAPPVLRAVLVAIRSPLGG